MPVSLFSKVLRSEGLRHVLALGLTGTREDLLRVREVVYDLGPTFDERYRTRTAADGAPGDADPAGAFQIEVEAYGDFGLSARVAVGDGRVDELTHAVSVSTGRREAPEPPSSYGAPASARDTDWTGVILGTSAVALGAVALVAAVGD